MTKGEKRFEDALMKCLFPKGVPANHRVRRTPEYKKTLSAITTLGKDIADRHGLELLKDIDDAVPESATAVGAVDPHDGSTPVCPRA